MFCFKRHLITSNHTKDYNDNTLLIKVIFVIHCTAENYFYLTSRQGFSVLWEGGIPDSSLMSASFSIPRLYPQITLTFVCNTVQSTACQLQHCGSFTKTTEKERILLPRNNLMLGYKAFATK